MSSNYTVLSSLAGSDDNPSEEHNTTTMLIVIAITLTSSIGMGIYMLRKRFQNQEVVILEHNL